MADPQETTITKALEAALEAISEGSTELGWTYTREPHVERAVRWTPDMLNTGYETIYILTPLRIDPVELAGKRTRNTMSVLAVLAGQPISGANFENQDERLDAASVMYHEVRTRLIGSLTTSGGELAALKSTAGLHNVEITLDEYGTQTAGMAVWQLVFCEFVVTYTVTYP